MNQIQNDKYTIAWFKLAEFISRGEKEKALGIYRLLSHSLPDSAFSLQLEADLLLSFKDEKGACESYKKAADLYERQKKHIESACCYESLLILNPFNIIYSKKLVEIYSNLKIESKLLKSLFSLVDAHIFHNQIKDLDQIINLGQLSDLHKFLIFEHVIVKLLEANSPKPVLHDFITKSIILSDCLDGKYLSSLISKLSIDTESFEFAQGCLKK